MVAALGVKSHLSNLLGGHCGDANGSTRRVPTTVKQLGDYLFLTLDANNHPAYTGKVIKGPATGQAAKFKRKFDFLTNATLGKAKK